MFVIKSIAYSGLCAALVMSSVNLMGQSATPGTKIAPATMSKIGTVDERFQSYNIETVEVTGGRFWKPYASQAKSESNAQKRDSSAPQAAGIDPSLFEYRSPIDLSNVRLRKLAAALGPAYVRVSGTWMNTTYFQDSDEPAPAAPPKGFNSVLTRKEWKGVVDFARATNAEIVTSFSVSAGTRNAEGVWTPDQARKLMNYTKSLKGRIAAAEFMNEPTIPEAGGGPKGYDAKTFARDFAVFRQFAEKDAPGMKILGPGGVGEGTPLLPSTMHMMKSEDILAATGPSFTDFSYHFYGAVSHRCSQFGGDTLTSSENALSSEWLSRVAKNEAYYAEIRDKGLPGKPMWITETAQAACGGDRWASTYIDTFRYLNQLGTLAKLGVQVNMHNTLASSDYGLLDEKTNEPRPDYWAALLWRRLMGNTVLDPGQSSEPNLHVYAQCLRDKPGGVTVLAINADRNASQSIEVPTKADAYTLTAAQLESGTVLLNGSELKLGNDDSLPKLKARSIGPGHVTLAPASITFIAFQKAGNASCR